MDREKIMSGMTAKPCLEDYWGYGETL